MGGVVGILLAAGAGRRFGSNKLLQPLPDGTPVGVAAARSLVRVLPGTLAVVRPGEVELAEALGSLGLQTLENPDPDRGMGASLALAIRASAGAAGWVVALADMPWVRDDTLRGLVGRLHAGSSLVAPRYRGRRGNPVGFAAAWGERLATLDGDRGARDLIAAHPGALEWWPTDDPGVIADVDRPGDLMRWSAEPRPV